MTSALFSPLSLREVNLSNRVVVSPMCQYMAADGSADDWHLMHYGQFAVSGVGLIIVEATHVEAHGRITHGCLGLYSDANEAALTRIVAFCRRHGDARLGVHLSHAGRKGSARLPWIGRGQALTAEEGAWPTVAASSLPYNDGWPKPAALDHAGLQRIKASHVAATRRAARIGFDLIEFNAAHGYLLHEFLSPLSNQRGDAYGGSLENRMRFPLEVFAAMREAWPADRPMGVRHSVKDWVEGGWQIEDAIAFVAALQKLGCDYVAASSGGLSPQQRIDIGEGHQVPFARRLREETGLPSMAVGMIFDPDHAERIVAEGDADFVAMARGMLCEPHWTWRAAAKLGSDVRYPPQYIRGYRSAWHRDASAFR
jgi:2,4-dienoyl-CoA reductase-like NADH-dependent reductase (Old Yellow Enzyme family)